MFEVEGRLREMREGLTGRIITQPLHQPVTKRAQTKHIIFFFDPFDRLTGLY